MSMWGRYTLRERTRGQPLTGGQEELRTTVISFDIPVVGSLFVIPLHRITASISSTIITSLPSMS